MFIYDVLKMDHRMALDIVDTIERVDDGERRKDMLHLLRVELTMHARSEEEAFYAPLRKRLGDDPPGGAMPSGKALIDTAEDEHRHIEQLLAQLSAGAGEEDSWLCDLRDLRALLQRHILKEEIDAFHAAEAVFNHTELADMAARFLEGKGRLGTANPIAAAAHMIRDALS